ncbi:unnamed protein product [Eruca vesicaria subsp. sativa]|uniref:F-box domain-containing protein n=1 Tax=Eruca vesicaria subsp. sativa TaxID=29727 RepID=A0ABC8KJ25_ERUVS|nr:unnamed protein product [Eruca vesicaria subsp. sativa]
MKNDQECSLVNMITHLPDDLLLNCLARVSRLYYPILSLVSKRLRSLIASLELYQTRTLLRHSESCLYLCLRFSSSSNPRWFTLCRRPSKIPNPNINPNSSPNPNTQWFTPCFKPHRSLKNQTKKEEKRSSNYLMVSVPTRNFSVESLPNHAVIGSNIYSIGIDSKLCSVKVFFLDCRSYTWHEAPSMRMKRIWPHMSVIDGKIYVVEQWNVPPSNSIEIYDPKTQIWDYLPCPIAEILGQKFMIKSLAIDGKLYLCGDKCMVYKPMENKWDVVLGYETLFLWTQFKFSCVINNVLYSSKLSRVISWYDSDERIWRYLKGLEELPKLPRSFSRLRLVNYGGKIAVLWEKSGVFSRKKMIWCAVIAVERRSGQEIYGIIEWCDVVLTVPKSCCVLESIAVTI